MYNILTIDVEDFHHRLAYRKNCQLTNSSFSGTGLAGVKIFINLLKENGDHKATFFVIGELLEKNPELAKLIVENGHEIANHTYFHQELEDFTTPEMFIQDLKKVNKIFFDSCGVKPIGFRAPKWSIKDEMKWVLPSLSSLDYEYDASIFPASGYGYGIKNARMYHYKANIEDFMLEDRNSNFFEFPTTVWGNSSFRIANKFRHFGYWFTKSSIERANSLGKPAVKLLHSWELIKPPKSLLRLGSFQKNFIRNYKIPAINMLKKLLLEFKFTSIRKYLEDHQ